MRPVSGGPSLSPLERREFPGSANNTPPTARPRDVWERWAPPVKAYSNLAVVDKVQRRADLHQALGLTFRDAGCEFPLTCELHRVDLFVGLDNPEVLTGVTYRRSLIPIPSGFCRDMKARRVPNLSLLCCGLSRATWSFDGTRRTICQGRRGF
jgi:hypothetical protein